MANKEKKKDKADNIAQKQENMTRGFGRELLVSIMTAVITSVLFGVIVFVTKLYTLPDRVEAIEKTLNDPEHGLSARMVRIETKVGVSGPVAVNTQEDIEEPVKEDNNIIEQVVATVISIKPTKTFQKLVASAAGIDRTLTKEEFMEEAGVEEDEPVATSIDGIVEYSASELIDQTVVLAYEDSGYQVFFQGQYNENYHWDGECFINSYKNGLLYAATIAVYDDGIRKEYKQLIADGDEWNYTERECDGDINVGDSWIYAKSEDLKQTADFDNPSSDDFYDVEKYKDYIGEGKLLKRYHGNTSGGRFNDDTGNAWLISYDSEGFVKTLYCGGITKGNYDDITGNAWYITRNPDKGLKYAYYKGEFKNGKSGMDNSNLDYVTKDRIEEYTKGQPYESELNWNWEYVQE